jgi:hypothetical protein
MGWETTVLDGHVLVNHDGGTATVRAMAETVLNIATNRPYPDQGIRLERLNLIVFLLVAALTVALVVSVARIPTRYRQLAALGFPSEASFARSIGLTAILHFVWPLALLMVAFTASYWVLIVMFQPDIAYWAAAVAVVVFLKGVLEATIAWRAFGNKEQREPGTGTWEL